MADARAVSRYSAERRIRELLLLLLGAAGYGISIAFGAAPGHATVALVRGAVLFGGAMLVMRLLVSGPTGVLPWLRRRGRQPDPLPPTAEIVAPSLRPRWSDGLILLLLAAAGVDDARTAAFFAGYGVGAAIVDFFAGGLIDRLNTASGIELFVLLRPRQRWQATFFQRSVVIPADAGG